MKNWITIKLAQMLGISKAVLAFFLPIFASAISTSLEKLLPLALQIVTQLALNNQLGNAEKRAAAVSQLSTAATTEGIVCGISVLNLAVEAAVSQLKATTLAK